jgi:primosomal protein N'
MPLHVAVPVPFLPLLTYSVPDGMTPPVRGARVLVPLGTRHVTGCVIAVDAAVSPDLELRPVIDVLDQEAFLPGHVIDLALWASEYYAAGPGETIAAAMPPFAWVASERHVSITEAGRARLAAAAPGQGGAALVVLRALADGRSFTPRELTAAAGGAAGSLDAVIRVLVREGLAVSAQTMRGKASAFRTMRVASLTLEGQ